MDEMRSTQGNRIQKSLRAIPEATDRESVGLTPPDYKPRAFSGSGDKSKARGQRKGGNVKGGQVTHKIVNNGALTDTDSKAKMRSVVKRRQLQGRKPFRV